MRVRDIPLLPGYPLTQIIRKVRQGVFGNKCRLQPAPKPSTFWPPPHLHHGAVQEDTHHPARLTKSPKIPSRPRVMPCYRHTIDHPGDHSFAMLRVLRCKQLAYHGVWWEHHIVFEFSSGPPPRCTSQSTSRYSVMQSLLYAGPRGKLHHVKDLS